MKEASEKTGMVQFTPADCMAGRTRNVRSYYEVAGTDAYYTVPATGPKAQL